MDDQIYRGDDGTALRFYTQAVKNNFQSERNGRPLFDTALMVDVMTPGSNESAPTFMVERKYCDEANVTSPERTPKYEQYKAQIEAWRSQSGEGLVDGMPLSQWAQMDAGTVANLKAQGIGSVEALASVSDAHLANLGTGGRVLRDQAIAFINTRQFGVPTAQMSAETTHLREENARLVQDNNDLGQRLTLALEENRAFRTGQMPPVSPPGAAPVVSDPLGFNTVSQPNPLASLDTANASTLTPAEGDTNDAQKQRSENLDGRAPPPPLI